MIIVAIDEINLKKASVILNNLDPKKCMVKIGSVSFNSIGQEIIFYAAERGFDIFLDLKLGPEIPNQIKKTVSALSSQKCIKYLTIHTSGDYEMLKAAREAAGEIELLGVTVLTTQENLQNLGIKNSIKDQVKLLVNLAIKSEISGVIASAQDFHLIRSLSRDLKIFCPGIRSEDDKKHDQKRIMSYKDFSKIADDKCFAVIGRPIIEGDPVQNIKKIIQS